MFSSGFASYLKAVSIREEANTIGESSPSTQAEVTYLELTICVYEQIARLQVPVDNRRRMDVLHAWMSIVIGQRRRIKSDNHEPRRTWYRKYWTCSFVSVCPDLMIWCRSAARTLVRTVHKTSFTHRLRTFHGLEGDRRGQICVHKRTSGSVPP